MKKLLVAVMLLISIFLNAEDSEKLGQLEETILQEGETIQKLIVNNTKPQVIVTTWKEPSFEKAFSLGKIPEIKRFSACYRDRSCWMSPVIGSHIADLPIETQYFLGDLGNNRFVMLIPLVDDIFRSSLQGTKDNQLAIILETGDVQLKGTQSASLYLSTGDNPYNMIRDASTLLADYMKTFRLRENKKTPWYVDYLGWHSWNAFYQHVSQDSTIKALNNFRDRELPIKWIMIDDGVQGQKDRMLISYDADTVKFPNGLKEMTDIAKNEYGMEKVFAWSMPWGYWWGIDTTVFTNYRKVNFTPPTRYNTMQTRHDDVNRDDILKESTIGPRFYPNSFVNQSLNIPGPTFGDFYHEYFKYLREQGIDGMKLDAMTWVETLGNNGKGGRIKWMRELLDGFQCAGDVQFNGELINCSSCSNDYFFNTLTANVTRSSMDFYPDIPATHGNHIYINAHTSFWIGHKVLPDWDMFQTGHYTGAFHAAARAISGGPIYISDEVAKENKQTINALATSRGELLRCIDHGQVCRDNLFTDIAKEKEAIKIFNHNLFNSIVGTFNCSYDENNPIIVTSQVKASDVEGIKGTDFAVYNFKTGAVTKVGMMEKFTEKLDPLDFNIYTISRVSEGFAPIGLAGKYNPGGAIKSFAKVDKNEWVISLMDGGELICYAEKEPEKVLFNSNPVSFSYSDNLLKVQLPLQEEVVVKITMK